jgi:hypothetical protein
MDHLSILPTLDEIDALVASSERRSVVFARLHEHQAKNNDMLSFIDAYVKDECTKPKIDYMYLSKIEHSRHECRKIAKRIQIALRKMDTTLSARSHQIYDAIDAELSKHRLQINYMYVKKLRAELDESLLEPACTHHVIHVPPTFDVALLECSRNALITWANASDVPTFQAYAANDRFYAVLRAWGLRWNCRCRIQKRMDGVQIIVTGVQFGTPAPTASIEAIQYRINNQHFFETELYNELNNQIHVFVDVSNVMIASQFRKGGGGRFFNCRLNYDRLHELVVGLRTPKTLEARGSVSSDTETLFEGWRHLGYNLQLARRDKGQPEQFVDASLVAEMQSVILRRSNHETKTMVLISGDGNNNNNCANFRETVCAALDHGWHVEVWAWEHSCNSVYKRFAAGSGLTREEHDRFKLCYLDPFRDHVTFVKHNA